MQLSIGNRSQWRQLNLLELFNRRKTSRGRMAGTQHASRQRMSAHELNLRIRGPMRHHQRQIVAHSGSLAREHPIIDQHGGHTRSGAILPGSPTGGIRGSDRRRARRAGGNYTRAMA